MKILVIGSGGREHALVWKMSLSPSVKKIFAAPGNAGMAELAECLPIPPSDLKGLLRLALSEKIDLTVVGPELPLVSGVVDLFEKSGLLIFGPDAQAARLEGSKVFSKSCMKKYGIPTAPYEVFNSAEDAGHYLLAHEPPFVIKADGLAAGKGVVVAETVEDGRRAVTRILESKIFGEAGREILIESYLRGEELSILAFTDGKNVVPLASSQDHKRALDQDQGPNTGGMGAYSPCPLVNETELEILVAKTITPLIHGLAHDGIRYRGLIYAGLMMTDKGPFVLEYNVRFGDPEAQAVLPRLEEDIVPILEKAASGHLPANPLRWKPQSALSVVLASNGYPGEYRFGFPISGLEDFSGSANPLLFHAGTKRDSSQKVVTAGGRVLNVTALGDSLRQARDRAYEAVRRIHFEGVFYRKDIGWRALAEIN